MGQQVRCPVQDDGSVSKVRANAFRILDEVGNAFFLDFIYICPTTSEAKVVARMRVQYETLQAVRDRLQRDVLDSIGVVH